MLKQKIVVATVLTVYGIETEFSFTFKSCGQRVATVLTVYGIETHRNYVELNKFHIRCNSTYRLRY